jgi:hypothetical protein
MGESKNTDAPESPGPREEPKAVEPARENFSPSLLDQLWESKTKLNAEAMAGGGELIKRTKLTFTVDGAVCSPDFFVDENGDYYDVQLTMQSLMSDEELDALAGISTPSAAPLMLAKQALCALNGRALTQVQRDWLWEALGMGGRQLCFLAFQQIGSAGASALGKFRRSSTIS